MFSTLDREQRSSSDRNECWCLQVNRQESNGSCHLDHVPNVKCNEQPFKEKQINGNVKRQITKDTHSVNRRQ